MVGSPIKLILKTLLAVFVFFGAPISLLAATTINATNHFAYGANIGWINWRGDITNGAVVGEYVCSGYIYSANVGWIHLGNNAPENGIQYQNNSATDYGINRDGQGNLRGFAYGANIGWVNFDTNGAPKVDLLTGKLTGAVFSANCGWISLSNSSAFVQTDTVQKGPDTDSDGIADAWERIYFRNLTTVNAASDFDGDEFSDRAEYLADTFPTNAADSLRITDFSTASLGQSSTITWRTKPTRFYFVQKQDVLGLSPWQDSGLGLIIPDGTSTTRPIADNPVANRFYRIQVARPLIP